ncbi:hypothetical protein [Actinoalloteichus hymeniacidonis]|uniref:Uncharacterized protein n=1 Tax=Actinoalloteichus hymeniacidonis TaxID=340345 RepID=A0AAC9HVM0_9PSEU|nr:hypothetical protein [Actinoalloteichus hymeniacidonis]AOS65330.1 hypothetical protein TL08_22750 [Actinoalloteichus hymeniacidonis]MBB5906584.1 hypothetical protein [Actinoalloteichus hymeniacidonis]
MTPDGDVVQQPGHDDEVITTVSEPRMCALRELREDIEDRVVFAWGMSMGTRSVLCYPDGSLFATSGRAEESVALGVRAGRRIELVWLG